MKAFVLRFWKRLPVVVRSVIAGIAVLIGNQPPIALLILNTVAWPAVPWSVPLAGTWLWFYWRYLQGHWWPAATAEDRRESLRARDLSPGLWRWSLIAGGFAIASGFPLAFMLPLGVNLPPAFFRVPAGTALLILCALSCVAGIVEEAAFRGYMQGPIERRMGPVVAIVIVTVIFALVHLPGQRVTPIRMLLIVLASVTYGVLASFTRSILPGIVLHATGNAFGLCLLWWLTKHAGPGRSRLTADDALFWLYAGESVLLTIAAVWAFRRLYLVSK